MHEREKERKEKYNFNNNYSLILNAQNPNDVIHTLTCNKHKMKDSNEEKTAKEARIQFFFYYQSDRISFGNSNIDMRLIRSDRIVIANTVVRCFFFLFIILHFIMSIDAFLCKFFFFFIIIITQQEER